MQEQAPERVPQRWPHHSKKEASSASGPAVLIKGNRSLLD